MGVADINTRVAAAVAAIDGGDYATAHRQLLAAKALLAGTPDSQKGSASLRWDRGAIDALIATCERQIQVATTTASGATLNSRGVVRTKVTYKRVNSSQDDEC